MAEKPDNIILVMLRRIDARLERLVDDVQDLKIRMTHVVEELAGVNRRLDRLEVRVDRIEKRLGLIDA